jgi:hypothetical protein
VKGDRKARRRELSAAEQRFLDVVRTAPAPEKLPWMLVELPGESGTLYTFALAVHEGWVVAAAPLARAVIGHRARHVWMLFRGRGARLTRLNPEETRDERLLKVSRSDFWPNFAIS